MSDIFFKFILTDCAPPGQVFPNETSLEQVEHKGLDGGEDEDGGHVEEGDQLGHKVRALISSHIQFMQLTPESCLPHLPLDAKL